MTLCYELIFSGEAVSTAVALTAAGWAIGNVLHYMPSASSSTRAYGAMMRDYSMFSAGLIGAAAGIGAFVSSVVSAFTTGSQFSCGFAIEFFRNVAFGAMGFLAALSIGLAAVAAIPGIGSAIALVLTVLFTPLYIGISAIIIPLSIVTWLILTAYQIAGPFLFPTGILLMTAPGRILKSVGATLVAFGIVFAAAGPLIPVAMATIIASNGENVNLNPNMVDDLKSVLPPEPSPSAYFAWFFGTNLTSIFDQWFLIVQLVLVAFLVVGIAFLFARGLASSLGGAPMNV